MQLTRGGWNSSSKSARNFAPVVTMDPMEEMLRTAKLIPSFAFRGIVSAQLVWHSVVAG